MSNRRPHWHACTAGECEEWGTTLLVPIGPITGMSAVAEELIRHFEVDPAEHPGLRDEVERTISEDMLDTAREIFRERGIPIPAEQAGA